jgi:hypothetical protein
MKTMTKVIFATTLGLLLTVPAYAGHGDWEHVFRARMQSQHERIEQGVDSRELTRKEARVLEREYDRIRMLAREFRKDGHVSRKERHRLDNELDKLSGLIKEYKHNHLERHRKPKYQYEHESHDDYRGEHESYGQ